MQSFSNAQLRDVLLEAELLTPKKWKEIEDEAKLKSVPITELLVAKDVISDEHIGQLLADAIGIPFVNLRSQPMQSEALAWVPEVMAMRQQIFPFRQSGDELDLAMAHPDNLELIRAIQKRAQLRVVPYYATERDIREAMKYYRAGIRETFEVMIAESAKAAAKSKRAEEVPVVRLLDGLLDYAYENNASDIHIEPHEKVIVVRYRIDGILHDVVTLPKTLLDTLVTRIKIMSKLRTDEHRSAQDGKLQFQTADGRVDVRVSVIPVSEGEKAVLRVLSGKGRSFGLEDLGLSGKDLEKVEQAIQRPHGMILATGPTGSGKTTTLYAILKILNRRDVNISAIEDPIEYHVEGVNQIQVNPKTNLTFSAGLRSILRQDPDIIMVGEIRDAETAGISVNAALTGHLVLSSVHTNDAPTTVIRLLDMGIEPFLVASTVNVVIAQRLVRSICNHCVQSVETKGKDLEALKKRFDISIIAGADAKSLRLYKGKGCSICNFTGFFGRIGVFEVMVMSDAVRDLCVARASVEKIRNQAMKEGMTSMMQDGLVKVAKGLTTIEEVLRVTVEK